MLLLLLAALPLPSPSPEWRPPSEPVVVVAREEAAWKVSSRTEAGFTLESVASHPVRAGDAFAVRVRIRLDIHTKAIPELACYDASGHELKWASSYSAPAASTTNWQEYRRVFAASPGATEVRARVRGSGKGDFWLADFEFQPVTVDPYQTGVLVSQIHPRSRAGLVLESNLGVVNTGLLSEEDRDGDGKWAIIRVDLDKLSEQPTNSVDWRTGFAFKPNEIYWSDGAALKSDSVLADRPPEIAKALHFRRSAHPGPYQAIMNDPGRSVAVSLDGKTWKRFDGGQEAVLGNLAMIDGVFEMWVDACYRDAASAGPVYFDYVRLMPVDKAPSATWLFEAAAKKTPQATRGTAEERKVRVSFSAPPYAHGARWPVRASVPIPPGELTAAAHAAIFDSAGAPVPTQNRALATWHDGSVKWLYLDFQHDFARSGRGDYTVAYGERVEARAPATGVRVEQVAGGLEVDTGAIRFLISKSRFGLVEKVRAAAGATLQQEPVAIEIAEAGGKIWRALELPVERIEIEQAGPLHTVILASTKLAPSGQPAAGFHHRARIHAYAGSPLVQVDYFVANTDEREKVLTRSIALRVRPEQADSGRGAIVQKDEKTAGHGWVSRPGLSVGLEAFREQYPKALRWDARDVEIALWAPEGGDYEWIQSVGKTHRVALWYGPPAEDAALLAHGPVLALAEPAWYCASGAFGPQTPAAQSPLPAAEKLLADHMDQFVIGKLGLGFENYGDHSSAGYVKGSFLWDNNEYDLPAAAMVHFVRTGNRRALEVALASALHYTDVDTIHYSRARRESYGGAHTHSHGTYGHHTAEKPGMNHAGYVQGLVWASYFTGDPDGILGAKDIANWVLANMKPTSSVTGMERALGHPLMTLNDVYEATWDPAYLRGSARHVDWAMKWEDPVRGGFPGPLTEKPAFSTGSPFCSGVMFSALMKFNSWARLPELDALLERTARHILTDMWRPEGILFKGGSSGNGRAFEIVSHSRMMGSVYARTGDPLFLAVPRELVAQAFGEKGATWGTRTTGLVYNYLPWFLTTLAENGNPQPESALSVTVRQPAIETTRGGKIRACVVVKNHGATPVTEFKASFQPRLDFAVTQPAAMPAKLAPGQEFEAWYEVQAPEAINLTFAANRTSFAQWSATYRRAGAAHLAHAWLKVELKDR